MITSIRSPDVLAGRHVGTPCWDTSYYVSSLRYVLIRTTISYQPQKGCALMLWRIVPFARPYWRRILTIALLITVMAAFNQVEPFVSQRITDGLVNQRHQANFARVLLVWLGAFLATKWLSSVLNRLTWRLTNLFVVQFESHLKQIGFHHLMQLSMGFFNDQSSGKMMSKLDRGVNRIVTIVNNSGAHFLPSVTTALISLVVVTYYQWQITASILVAFIPYILINRWRFERNSKLERHEYKLYDNQYSHFWEVLGSMTLIKAFRAEKFEAKRFKDFFRDLFNLRREMENNADKALAGDLFLETWNWAMYAYVVWLTWTGDLTLGTMVLLINMIGLIRQPLWQLNWIFWEVKRAGIGAKDFFRIMDVQPDVVDPDVPVPLTNVRGTIRFENVSFTYKNAAPIPDSEAEEFETQEGEAEDGETDAGKEDVAKENMVEKVKLQEIEDGAKADERKKDEGKKDAARVNAVKKNIIGDGSSSSDKNGRQDKDRHKNNRQHKKSVQQGPQQVFQDLTLELAAGQTTAFVGPSGSGKTTIAQLVLRFFDPDAGRITLDGIDIRNVAQRDLRAHMGLVSQDPYLFADSIANNLRYARPGASEAEMWAACRAAYADEFIQKLPAGLDTEIGDRGVKLSGGQRQRLSLARTILAEPRIIILDEATSALDSESEWYIQKALAKILRGRTAIVIAHRLSTIQRADKIIVLQNKGILEQGTHAELLRRDGLYASLFKIQSGDQEKLREWDLVG